MLCGGEYCYKIVGSEENVDELQFVPKNSAVAKILLVQPYCL